MLKMLYSQLNKMLDDHSFVLGSIASLTTVIPGFVKVNQLWSTVHTVLLCILFAVFVMDWITGRKLSVLSTTVFKTSKVANEALQRDFIIVIMCVTAAFIDFYLIGKWSVCFSALTVAFIYHNFYSVVANISVLGWDKHFPMWLFDLIDKWANNEKQAKLEKYFPELVEDKEEK